MEKQAKKVVIIKSRVIYDHQEESAKSQPTFKPGNEPQYRLGSELLNGKVNWQETLEEVLATKKHTIDSLSKQLEVHKDVFSRVLKNDLSLLNFKTGARLLGVHCSIRPELYC